MYVVLPSEQELQQSPDYIPPYSRTILSKFDMEKVQKEENAPSPSPQSSKKHKKQKKASVFPNLEDMDFEQSGLYKVYEDNRRWMNMKQGKRMRIHWVKPIAQPATPTVRAMLKIRNALRLRVPDTSSSLSYSGPLVPAVSPLVSNKTSLSPLVQIVPPKPASVLIVPKLAVIKPRILKRRGRPPKVEKIAL
ncbi:hypothetical protein CAEBREN_04553 [Caenorhabditis brenneri]|uniref:Uncharacterized protein n=1 Tax=Caenorhabditis brenneri TaxID=135651 RepID=G0NW80_CAEBE|nr:hypothetical protein CAEBREN_04553 [Caenorhabditis brenneri]